MTEGFDDAGAVRRAVKGDLYRGDALVRGGFIEQAQEAPEALVGVGKQNVALDNAVESDGALFGREGLVKKLGAAPEGFGEGGNAAHIEGRAAREKLIVRKPEMRSERGAEGFRNAARYPKSYRWERVSEADSLPYSVGDGHFSEGKFLKRNVGGEHGVNRSVLF